LAAGLTVPLAAGASAAGLRKLCEDVPDISQEPSNIEGLLRIGEVTPLCLFSDFGFMSAIGRVLGLLFSDVHSDSAPKRWIGTLRADRVVSSGTTDFGQNLCKWGSQLQSTVLQSFYGFAGGPCSSVILARRGRCDVCSRTSALHSD